VIAFAVVDDALSPDFPLGVELEVFIRGEDAERFSDFAASARLLSACTRRVRVL